MSLCNKIIRKSQLRLSTLSLENINCISFGRGLLDVSIFFYIFYSGYLYCSIRRNSIKSAFYKIITDV